MAQHKDSGRSATCNAGSSSAPRDGTAEGSLWAEPLRVDQQYGPAAAIGIDDANGMGVAVAVSPQLGNDPLIAAEIVRRCNGYPRLAAAGRAILIALNGRVHSREAVAALADMDALLRELGEKL